MLDIKNLQTLFELGSQLNKGQQKTSETHKEAPQKNSAPKAEEKSAWGKFGDAFKEKPEKAGGAPPNTSSTGEKTGSKSENTGFFDGIFGGGKKNEEVNNNSKSSNSADQRGRSASPAHDSKGNFFSSIFPNKKEEEEKKRAAAAAARARQRPREKHVAPPLPAEPGALENPVLNVANKGVYKTARTCGQGAERTCGPTGGAGRALEGFQHNVLESDEPFKNAGKSAFSATNDGVQSFTGVMGHGAEKAFGQGTKIGSKLEEWQHRFIEKDMHLYDKVHKRPGKGRRVANRYKDEHDLYNPEPHQQHARHGQYQPQNIDYTPARQQPGFFDSLLKPYNDPYEDEYSLLGPHPSKARGSSGRMVEHV